MVQPRLIHPVPVVLERINRDTTKERADAREPIQQAARHPAVTIQGQPNWTAVVGGGRSLQVTRLGPQEDALGYVLFRYADLNAQSITLQMNDRIKKIGFREGDWYINRLQDVGHYSDAGGPTLVRAYFKDRDPTKKGV